jgi:CRISP-associated protein Cas1
MGTLYIDRKGLTVKLHEGTLVFYANNSHEGTVPIHPLKRVVVIGGVIIDTPVLNKLCDENISVLFLSGRRMRFHGRLQGKLHNNGLLRVKQYEKSLSIFPCEFSHDIVSRKMAAQETLLSDALTGRPDLRFPLTRALGTLTNIEESLWTLKDSGTTLPAAPTAPTLIESLRGYEGSAASAYFSGFMSLFAPSLRFNKRTRRPPEDPVNAMLSLLYTMLHYEMVREIETIGLDPAIGFYHQFDYGRESLASDLIEPFRPQADRFVWTIFRDRTFTERDFAYSSERPGCYLKKGSRRRFYPLYEEWARNMRPELTAEVRSLANAIMGYNYADGWDAVEPTGYGDDNDE